MPNDEVAIELTSVARYILPHLLALLIFSAILAPGVTDASSPTVALGFVVSRAPESRRRSCSRVLSSMATSTC